MKPSWQESMIRWALGVVVEVDVVVVEVEVAVSGMNIKHLWISKCF